MAHDQMNVAIHASVFVLTHFIGHDAGWIIDLRKSRRTRRPANVFPGRAAVAAARHAALFDADDNFIRHPCIERDAASMRYMRTRWKRPLVIIGQSAESRKLAKGSAAVLTHIDRREQYADV